MKFVRSLPWRPGRYLRNTGVVLTWLLVRAVAQAALVVALSRLLGAAGYGRFVAVIAVASLFTALAGLGLSGVVLRDGARAPQSLDTLMLDALRTWGWTSVTFGLAAIGTSWLLLPHDLPWAGVCLIVFTEVGSASVTELFARGQQAAHRMSRYGAITAGLPLSRLAVLVPYAILAHPTLQGWFLLYAAASATYCALVGAWLWPREAHKARRRTLSLDGLPFAINALSMRLQAEFNKPVLARIGFDHTGTFSAAQRTIDVASLPLAALQEALWPRLYSQNDPSRGLRTLGALQMCVALSIACALWMLGPLLPRVLGSDFDTATDALRMLAALPVLQAFRGLVNFHVIHRHRTAAIAWAASIGAVVNVCVVSWSIPRWGATGAALSCYVTELAMLIVLVAGSRVLPARMVYVATGGDQ
ncbi:lipopolysaccharide biosynthesis protein [Lysobacter claricitrinus]|uniref:lipopolysaccharide biosynthesis protein n=1 Tax=Lysobacter claricitrinus TaxID=3367728 RepID=UPI0038B28CA4